MAHSEPGVVFVPFSRILCKHFNQFFMSCLSCVIIAEMSSVGAISVLQIFLVYAPLRPAQNRYPLDIKSENHNRGGYFIA